MMMMVWLPVTMLILTTSHMSRVSAQVQDYCQLSPQHTLCQYPGVGSSCVSLSTRGLSPDQTQQILDLHNGYRAGVARGETVQPPASNMMKLEWDPELAQVAQRLADQCIFNHDCADCRQVSRFRVGQNLYQGFAFGARPADLSTELRQAVETWYQEISVYPPGAVSRYSFSPNSGHYSQMVWASTSRLGCGLTEFPRGRFLARLLVCNYGEAGNVINAPMYNIGPACTQCPPSTSCSPMFPGLCSEVNEVLPPSTTMTPPPPRPVNTVAPVQFPASTSTSQRPFSPLFFPRNNTQSAPLESPVIVLSPSAPAPAVPLVPVPAQAVPLVPAPATAPVPVAGPVPVPVAAPVPVPLSQVPAGPSPVPVIPLSPAPVSSCAGNNNFFCLLGTRVMTTAHDVTDGVMNTATGVTDGVMNTAHHMAHMGEMVISGVTALPNFFFSTLLG